MSDIILAGVSITELKRQKQAIQKDASKFIADGVEQVKDIVSQIVEAIEEDETADVAELARKATEILENVSLVSGVSGIEYYLPHYDDYGYKNDGTPMYSQLEELGIDSDDVDVLMGYLEDMEYQVRKWNTSTC